MNIERIYLDTLLDRNLDRVADACWEILGPEPPEPIAADTPPELPQRLDRILRHRAMITLVNLAARKGATPEPVDRLLTYVDTAIAAESQDVGWKLLKQQLLIALDRPAELQKDLEQWVRVDDPDNRWRLALGYLLAEQGKFAPAITLFEAVQAADELGPARVPDPGRLVPGHRPGRQAASGAEFGLQVHRGMATEQLAVPEAPSLAAARGRAAQRVGPGRAPRASLRCSRSRPARRTTSRLRQFYQATHDFRLLTSLAGAVVGNTAGKVYPFLQRTSEVLGEVRDEATADSILEQIAKVRAGQDDRRSACARSAGGARRTPLGRGTQPAGPAHRQSGSSPPAPFQREWSAGEPRLMADLLAGLGQIAAPRLAEEQLRELEVLHGHAEKGSADWMHIGHRRANALWIHGRRDQAIDLLALVLDTYQAACKGVLPNHANGALDDYVSYLEQRTHHARGEQVLMRQLKRPANQQQTYWLRQRLYQLYESAIGQDGEVSLGRGPELYRAVNRRIQEELDTPDRGHRRQLINRLCSIYRTARNKKIEGVAEDLRTFAFQRMPQLMDGKDRPIDGSQPASQNVRTAAAGDEYQPIVHSVADVLHEIAGTHDALAFLVERIQAEPKWFRLNNRDGWSQFSSQLGYWRTQAKDLGDIEAPLLKLVLDELRRDLRTQQQRNRNMYDVGNSHYWKEKEAEFAKAAEEVCAERKTSGSTVAYIADYIYHGLHHFDRAIEMLWVAHGEQRLDEEGQARLVRFLHEQKRFGESIAVLQALVELRPDNIKYRTQLMHAYFQTKRPGELLGLLQQTDEYFHQENRWQEEAIAAVGESCLENALFEQSAAYYEEAVSLRKRNAANRGSGDGTLSGYCNNMARAYAGLWNTTKAVDAACEAIVSWGQIQNRTEALEGLKQVLRAAADLDGYAAGLDTLPQESPIVRKAIGTVYAEKRQYDKAIAQLTLVRQAEPNDAETHALLIACYDQRGDKEGAIQQTLASLQLSRRDIQLYKRLAELQRIGAGQGYRAGLHLDRRGPAHGIGEPYAPGRDPAAAEPLGRGGGTLAAGRPNSSTGADWPVEAGRGPDPPEAMGRCRRDAPQAGHPELAPAVRRRSRPGPQPGAADRAKALTAATTSGQETLPHQYHRCRQCPPSVPEHP